MCIIFVIGILIKIKYKSKEQAEGILITSSPMGNDRSPWSQHNVWRHHNLRCSKADNSELETVTRN